MSPAELATRHDSPAIVQRLRLMGCCYGLARKEIIQRFLISHPRFAGEIFAGVRGRLRQGKDVQRHRLGRPTLFMNEAPNSFRRLARKGSFAATFADLRGNVLNEHTASVDSKHFAHKIGLRRRISTNVTFKHSYFRRW